MAGAIGFLVAMAVFFWLMPNLSGVQVNGDDVFGAFQGFSSYAPVAAGVALTIFVGQFDLSPLGYFPLAGVIAAKTGVDAPVLGLLLVVLIGAGVGLLHGLVVTRLRINSMSVTLASAIAMLGVASIISHGDVVSYNNADFGLSLDAPIATIFSWHSLVCICVFVVLAAVMRFTRFGSEILSVGGDANGSRAAGVRVDGVITFSLVVSGALTGLAAGMLAYSFGSAAPDAAWSPLVLAITAALVGGASLAGGQGSFVGVMLGAVGLSLLQQAFTAMAAQLYVSTLVFGGILLLVAAATAPGIVGFVTGFVRDLRRSAVG